ncbi:hypothetical protein ACKWTF_015429 [Chironomus riparius]
MSKCEECNELFEATQKARFKCNENLCQVWTHKQCSDKRQVDKGGFWYCKTHIKNIPIEMRKSNVGDESTDNDGSNDEVNDAQVISKTIEKNSSDNDDVKLIENSKVNDLSNDHYSSLTLSPTNNRKSLNLHVTKRNKKENNKKFIPFDNNDDYNPFSNFNCGECDEKFTKEFQGALCTVCRSTYHLVCLNASELEDIKNHKFICQHCIENQIRHNNLNDNKNKVKYKDKKNKFSSSTPKVVHAKSDRKSYKKSVISNYDSSSSASSALISCESSNSSDIEINSKLLKKCQKLKKLLKKRNKIPKVKIPLRISTDDDGSDTDSDDISHGDAMIGIYKLTKEERDKSKYDKLPIVDNVDTKWSVFYDLFKQSRKMFSDSENVLRIQRSIKSKEILEIGGINLFDPRTYWLSLKLIDERLAKSFNLLYRETNEIIKIKKLRNDIESKKLIEFINKIINYSSIVERYGKRKHKMDERVISHIGNIMPYSLVNGWHKIKSRLEEKNKTVCIKHVAEYLSKQVPHINSKMQAEEIDPWKENNT